MIETQKAFKESSHWLKLAFCANVHIKNALRRILHNNVNDCTIKRCPSDPEELYQFLQNNKNKIQRSRCIKSEQLSILLPTSTKSVDSSSLDISLLRYLIQTFCHIKNAHGKWDEPVPSDKTICAYVYRAANIRNTIFHYSNIEKLDEIKFEEIWKKMRDILTGLKYFGDIEAIKAIEPLDPTKLQGEILQELLAHLESYKSECLMKSSDDFYIERRFSEFENKNNFVNKIEKMIKENDQVMIFGDAGIGKSTTARQIKQDWSKGKILKNYHLLSFNSKQMNQKIKYRSNAAPLFFSEMGDHLKKKGRNEMDFIFYQCVKTKIANLIILIDGIDELPIKEVVTKNFVDELEKKVKNSEELSAAETIIAIYFGFIFPYSKICLFGRTGEFEQLKKVNDKRDASIFNRKNRKFKDLKLLEFDDSNIKAFSCNKICKIQLNGQTKCNRDCLETYEKIKNIELCKNPTDLKSLIELHERQPEQAIESITRTKLIIASLLNRLNEHIYLKNHITFKSFHEILQQKDFSNYLDCICAIGHISFNAILKGKVTIEVQTSNDDTVYLKDQNGIKVERKILEELDFFYIRDFTHYLILEPYHTLNIEFLSSCYFFSHPEEWSSILELNKDRQLVIISFIAGLHDDDCFIKDFTKNVLNASDSSVESFFSWLYDVENIRINLPNGGYGYDCWYGLMKNQKLSPSFFLLDSISHEVDIPQTFVPSTIVCYCDYHFPLEWYNLAHFKHSIFTKNYDKLNINIDFFLQIYSDYDFIIKGYLWINSKHDFTNINECNANNRISFRIDDLHINTKLYTKFTSSFDLNSLHIKSDCDLCTINMILSALSPPITNPLSNVCLGVQCRRLDISNITKFTGHQTERLFANCLNGLVHYITLRKTFFTDRQIEILKNEESKHTNKLINIELYKVAFDHIFDLPNLGSRHISLNYVDKVNNDNLIELARHITRGDHHNFHNYKTILPRVPFIRQNDDFLKCEQSMYLHLLGVDLRQVSPEVFANVFSLIPSIACDDDDSIPSSHWLSLSQTEDCRINELRIWEPQPKNFEYFLDIEANLQFICINKDVLKRLLNHILDSQNIQLNKEIIIFAVNFDRYDHKYYEEIVFFSDTIGEFKNEFSPHNILLENTQVPFKEGEQHLNNWCCYISPLFLKNSDQGGNEFEDGKRSIFGMKDEAIPSRAIEDGMSSNRATVDEAIPQLAIINEVVSSNIVIEYEAIPNVSFEEQVMSSNIVASLNLPIENLASPGLAIVDESVTSNLVTVDESVTSNLATVDESETSNLATVDESVTSNLATVDESETSNLATVDESVTSNLVTVDESVTSNLATVDESVTSVLATVDESVTSNLATVDESETSNLATVDESETSNLATVDESVTSNLATVDESVTSNLATVDKSVTSNLAIVDEGSPDIVVVNDVIENPDNGYRCLLRRFCCLKTL